MLKSDITKATPRKITIPLFVVVFVLFWLYGSQRMGQPFVHDAMNYWLAGESFVKDSHFSLLNYSSPLRGYLFPLLLFTIQWQANLTGANPQMLFFLYSALFFSGLAIYLLPWFFRVVYQWETPSLKRLFFSALLFLFWRGHFLYPLTDFPSLGFLILGVGIWAGIGNSSVKPIWAVFAGIALGAAANIRPVYQASLVVILILVAYNWRGLGKKEILLTSVLFIFGIGLVFTPQLLINQIHFKTNSPFVMSTFIEDKSLYETQLFWGLKTQKYETNIGNDYPYASVIYKDPLAQKIKQKDLKEKTMRGYFNIFCSYPVEIVTSYFRHFFNGLDVFYATPYVKKIYADHTMFQFANYLVWFLTIYHLSTVFTKQNDIIPVFVVMSMLAPLILAVPIVVEVRFFLPAYLLAYGIVCYGMNYPGLFLQVSFRKTNFMKFSLTLIGWMLVCFTLSAGTLEQLQ